MPAQTQTHVKHNMPVPMRDGTMLRADVYRPDVDGRWPVILMRFVMEPAGDEFVEMGRFFSQRGYAFVFNDVRGTARSGGDFFPLVDEAWGENQDGYDTVEWAGHQPWSNGKVGLMGTSYGAFNQYTTAPTRPPSLRACMPFYGSNIKETVFPGGIYRLEEHRSWALWMALNCLEGQVAPAQRARVRAGVEAARADHESWIWHLPVTECPQLVGLAPWHFEQLTRAADLQWWAQTDAKGRLHEIDAPMLHVAGWYDLYLNGTLEHFTGLVEKGRTARCRDGQRLLIGPWTHGWCGEPMAPPPLDFGPESLPDFKEIALRWFDHWLKRPGEGSPDQPRVRLFLMGENRWLDLDQWPPANVTYTPVYLRQGTGATAASLNNGHLTFEAPSTGEQPDTFVFDPDDPIIGHHGSSPTVEIDQREREGQILTYTSEVLQEPLVVIGPVKAVIYASSSSPDTDWVVRLCNVWPDGRSIRVCDGIVRARFRHSPGEATLLEPGEVYRYEIDMTATAQTFLPGHRLRIHVTSSDFPRYDRNLNTGGPFGAEIEGQVAVNAVFHDLERPSHLVLPFI
ncbi:MAG: CocE/NonD family hydrolase [Caldilineaceae bacterium]|nr:CocE/NonD family hydrolase [Caldilineaceae bacterium]